MFDFADFESLQDFAEELLDWIDILANELVVGLIVALGLLIWVWKGRDNTDTPRPA